MDELNLHCLRTVAAVAESGSLSQAATTLGLAQSGVSRHLALAEAHFGAALFHRNGRGVTASPLGTQVLPGLRALLAQARALTEAGRAHARTPAGVVTLGLVPSLAGPLTSLLLGLLRAQHPQIQLQVREGYSGEMEAALADGRVDLAVVNRYRSRGPHRYQSICETRMCVVARPAVLQALLPTAAAPAPARRSATPALPAETRLALLGQAPLVMPLRPNALYSVLDTVAERAAITLNVVLHAGSSTILKRVLQDHAVVTVLPEHAVADELADHRLAAVPLAERSLRQHIVLATSPQRPFTAAAQVVARLVGPLVLGLAQRQAVPPRPQPVGRAMD